MRWHSDTVEESEIILMFYDNCDIFAGRLFPVNERATRTIRNLHVENERVNIFFSRRRNAEELYKKWFRTFCFFIYKNG